MAASTSTITTIKTVYGEDIRRFTVTGELASRTGCYAQIMQTIGDTYGLRTTPFTVTYTDDEGDPCSIGGDEEMREAIRFASSHSNKVLKLNVVKTSTATATIVPLAVAAQVPPTPTATAAATTTTAIPTIADAVPVVTVTATPTTVVEEKKVLGASAKFVRDVTIEDGSTVAIASTMTKTWSVQNDGSSTWPVDAVVALVSGEFADKGKTWPVPTAAAGETVDISIEVRIPAKVGAHKALLELRNADGTPFRGDNQLTIEVKARSTRNVEFVADVTIRDGTKVPCHSSHRKVWRIRNNGTAAWPTGALLIHNDGLVVNSPLFPTEEKGIPIPAAAVGETVELVAHIVAPARFGRNHGEWHMLTATGETFDGDYALWTQLDIEIPPLCAMDVIARLPTWLETPEIVAAIDKLRAKKNYRTSMFQPTEVLHRGVTCDGCGMYPIRGIRFKCTTCPDFDLCSACENKQINVGKHTIDHVFIQAKLPLTDVKCATAAVVKPPAAAKCVKFAKAKFEKKHGKVAHRADFVEDLTIPDGTVVLMGSALIKRWRVKNAGSDMWPAGVQLVYVGGDVTPTTPATGSPLPLEVPRAAAGQVVEIAARLQVPNKAGRFTGFYRLATADGIRFGHRFWVDVMSSPATTSPTSTTTATPSIPISVTTVTPLNRAVSTSTASPTGTTTVASAVVTAVTADSKTPAATPKATATPTPVVVAATAKPSPKYATQLAGLKAMGFKDDDMLLELLAAANGNERIVIDWLTNPVV